MAKLIYPTISSLDGFVADESGTFDWAKPDEEVHAFVNDIERPAGTHLYGRRLYEVLMAWETMDEHPDQSEFILDFAEIWQAAVRVDLELLAERRFATGFVYLHYGTRS